MCAFGCVLGILAACAGAQTTGTAQQISTDDRKQQLIPSRAVEFKAVETDPSFTLPSASTDYPHCLSDGSLVLQAIDWEGLKNRPKGQFPKYNHIVTIAQDKKTRTILSTSITGVTDSETLDIFPADSGIYMLFWGSKEPAGERGPGKSPTGQPLASYRSYVGRFDLDGTYKGAVELEAGCDFTQASKCELRHLAVFPSGDMLVTEADRQSSSLSVVYFKSSGEPVKQIDVPASRQNIDWGNASSNPQTVSAGKVFLSSVYFTAVGENIVVWRANSNDPLSR